MPATTPKSSSIQKKTKHLWADAMHTRTLCQPKPMVPPIEGSDVVLDTSELNPKTDELCCLCKTGALRMEPRS